NGKALKYTIPVPNGTYTDTTYHNELYFGKSGPSAKAGRRVFDISLEGKLVKTSFDMVVDSGQQTTVLVLIRIGAKDGKFNLDMSASADRASISGIAIEPSTNEDKRTEAPVGNHAVYLNTGSGDTYNYNGHTFVGDKAKSSYYNSTTTFSNSSASKDQLLQTERNGKSLKYTIPVP